MPMDFTEIGRIRMDKTEFANLFHNYEGISAILKNSTHQEIVSVVSELTTISPETLEAWPMGGYSKGRTSSAYHFVLEDLLRNVEHYDWLYGRLSDDISRKVFTKLMQFRLIPAMRLVEEAYDGVNRQYFDKAILSCDENEVFVDCGGFIGDTTEDYIREYKKYKKIYVYEPSGDNIEACRKNLKKYRDVIVKRCGVGEKSARMAMNTGKSSSSFVNAAPEQEAVEVISLDEDIREKITFIKMDIEGFEIPAIIGAKEHIKNDSPKLAVCIYHVISDMWEIPKLIDAINPNYRFYIRHYCKTQNGETVLYAILPCTKETRRKTSHGSKRIVAMAPYERGWTNVELIKDCGLIPYILHKNYNYDVSMVGADAGPYPYHEKYINGVKMEFLPSGNISEKVRYIAANARGIDALLIRGCYASNFPIADVYKQANPAGRIYIGLDANSSWMDRIEWDEPEFIRFMDNCDVIATSCSSIQTFLNEKWPWKVEYIPNGWYDFSHQRKEYVFESKENIILTVGRLGTAQKATEVLLDAFARIANQIPEWQLRLVGGVEETFRTYIQEYFERFPLLSGRVLFTGILTDREKLFQEYQNAKIFTMPSDWEGGTPNVIAEALHAGCVTAVTRFDAYEDATDHDRCGLSSEIRDVDGFAGILYRLCTDKNLKQLSEHAYKYSRRHFDMENITARVNEMLFGEGSYGNHLERR